MDLTRIDARLLSRPGATKALHEKWGWMVYWVGGRQFACEFTASPDAKAPYAGRHLLSLKCDPIASWSCASSTRTRCCPATTPTDARGFPSTWTPACPKASCSTSAT